MAQCYVAPITHVDEKDVFLAKVPAGKTLHAGDIIDLSELDTSIANNYQVYVGNAPTSSSTILGIVINDGWEMLADGRRPDGQPDYTRYEFASGEIVCVVALEKFMRFEISLDAINWSNYPSAGTYLAIDDGKYELVDSDSAGVFVVETEKALRAGGQFGGSLASGYIPTFICKVVGDNSAPFVPTGTITITENGTGIDVAQYATADVNVPTAQGNPIRLITVKMGNALGNTDKLSDICVSTNQFTAMYVYNQGFPKLVGSSFDTTLGTAGVMYDFVVKASKNGSAWDYTIGSFNTTAYTITASDLVNCTFDNGSVKLVDQTQDGSLTINVAQNNV